MAESTPFDASPDSALKAIQTFAGPVLVDLDETLYLRNSTEDFLDCASPGLLALLCLKVLDWVKPWRLTGGPVTRDVWRVQAIRIFTPWTMWTWRYRVAHLAREFRNEPLATALRGRRERPIISTVGFHPIVRPLVAALGFDDVRVIAARVNFQDRRRGKLSLVESALEAGTVGRALVVTDSGDDNPLLAACARPLRTIWPTARYRTALERVYVPGLYLSKIKRPKERYIWRGVLQEDFAFWWLSSIALAAQPVRFSAGLLLLCASFWVIYERGYIDNDRVGAALEKDPKLSAAFHGHQVATPSLTAWIWALLLGVGGVYLVVGTPAMLPLGLAKWVAALLFTELWFRGYNRVNKTSRIWLYAGLQALRSAAFVVIVPITPVGAAALAAHTLSRLVPYYVYRLGGKGWPKAPAQAMRLLFLLVLGGFLAISAGVGALWNASTAALLAWTVFRARHELRDILRDFSRLRP